jgi:hypothetical protein
MELSVLKGDVGSDGVVGSEYSIWAIARTKISSLRPSQQAE